MGRWIALAGFCLMIMTSTKGWAAHTVKHVTYQKGQDVFEGLLVVPEKVKAKAPGILMIHNWMGVTAETQKQAERMADLGFVVFAADIYGKGVRPKNPEAAGKEAGKYKANRQLLRERGQLALNTLREMPEVDNQKIIAVGYCFGGMGAMELARSGADIRGAVSFHGSLDSPNPADGARIKGAVLALHGADDPFVKAEDIAAFENEMRQNHIDWQLVKYGNAVHSFTEQGAGNDNSKGAAYNALADSRSFNAFKNFAAEILAK